MRKLLLLISLGFTFSSCSSTFFLSTLSTNDERTEKVENGDFLLENDTLWIAYCFNGEGAPIQITIFNKSKEPLYIDWQKSTLIINNVAFSYMGNRIKTTGSIDGVTFTDNSTILFDQAEVQLNNFSATTEYPNNTSFIPPNSMISHRPLNLRVNFENINSKEYHDFLMPNRYNEPTKVKRIDYNAENTPLRFRSYLTIYNDPNKPMVYEQEFYMENLIKTKSLSPKNMQKELAERGDLFYLEKPASTSFIEAALGITILVGVMAADAALHQHDQDYEY